MNVENCSVFLVDDDIDLCEVMMETFASEGINAMEFHNGSDMLKELDPEWNGIILSDLHMPKMDGHQLLHEAQNIAPDVPFIVITGFGDVDAALRAIRAGAFDFIEKPAAPDHLLTMIRRALKTRNLQIENERLRQRAPGSGNMSSRLVGRSHASRLLRKEIIELAQSNFSIFLRGELGTGKSLIAKILHDFSDTSGELLHLHGADLANGLAKLFDQVDENLDTGTVYIDNIDLIPLDIQDELAHYLEENCPYRVIISDVTGPDKSLETPILSEKLQYRLNPITMIIPAVRDRSKDAMVLLEHFIRIAVDNYQCKLPMISEEEVQRIINYPWPGNVSEVKIVAERAVLGMGLTLDRAQNFSLLAGATYDEAVQKFERDLIAGALMQNAGRKGKAAEILGMTRKRLYLKMKALGIFEPD